MVQWANKTTADVIREAVVAEVSRRDWLYVGLVDTEWKHHEDEEEYLRASGAVEALLDLARKLGLSEGLSGAEADGRTRLRNHMLDRKENGPARIEEIEAEMAKIERDVPMGEPRQTACERHDRGYYRLIGDRSCIKGDLEIAEVTLRYLDGEDIELG